MAINKNHEFDELDGVKCAIVEKNAPAERVDFLKTLLEYNQYTVVVVPSPPSKSPPPLQAKLDATPAPVEPAEMPPDSPTPPAEEPPLPPATFTIGVTDVTFNPTNAIFGRLLKTPGNQVVTMAYWQQNEAVSNDEVPYFQNPASKRTY